MAQITNSTLGFNAWDVAAVTYTGGGPVALDPNFLVWGTNGGVAPYNLFTATSIASNLGATGSVVLGTIDAISIASDTGAQKLSITDLSVNAGSLFLLAGGQPGWEAFWETVLAGTTTFNLSQGTMNIMGDYAYVNAGQTRVGAVDTFSGAINDLNGYFSGDAINVENGATLTGGADVFTFNSIAGSGGGSSITLAGDVGGNGLAVNGRVNGGADTFNINITQSQFAPISTSVTLYGDVERLTTNGVLLGGRDIISLTNVSGINLLTGDLGDGIGASITAGNDSITVQTAAANAFFAPGNFSIISGDANQLANSSFGGGADTILVRNESGSAIFGDAAFSNNTNFIGGNDTITFQNTAAVPLPPLPPAPPSTVGTIAGDAQNSAGTGNFTGGNDTITLANVLAGVIIGDIIAASNSGFFQGGNDTINYTYNYLPAGGGTQIVGDADNASNLSWTGGNDTITFTGNRGPGSNYQMFGDLRIYSTAAPNTGTFVGGNDIITLNTLDPNSSSLIVGDLEIASSILSFKGGNDRLTGGAGNDQIFGDSATPITATTNIGGNDILDGRDGDDLLNGGAGNDTAVYSSLNKSVFVNLNGIFGFGPSADYFEAMGQGFDQLVGIENVVGSNLNDVLIGDAARNILRGGNGNDKIDGGGGIDVLEGGAGNDFFFVNIASDVVTEAVGAGSDYIFSSVTYTAAANTERLYLTGTANINGVGLNLQNDTIIGNSGNNYINALSGNDLLFGKAGNDTLLGGIGQDSFYFDTALNATTNKDTILSFVAADDTIQLENAIFTALTTTGALAASLFKNLSIGALDANDRVVYNGATGALSYDADGSGAGAAIQFAQLSGNPVITAADFVVY